MLMDISIEKLKPKRGWLRNVLVLLSLLCCATTSGAMASNGNVVNHNAKQPLKVIAPDLVVESFEFGKFPNGKGPLDRVKPEQYKFIPVPSHIANEVGYAYGYRLKLRTTRPTVRLFQSCSSPCPAKFHKGDGYTAKVYKGAIYDEWLVDGFRNVPHWVQVWIEDFELPKLTYYVRY